MRFRRLLKDTTAGLYYTQHGNWSAEEAEGWDFPDTFTAVQTAAKIGRKDLHLILKFADSRLDISHALVEINPSSLPRTPRRSTELLLLALVPAASAAAPILRRFAG
jgi:hypothetical protein